jgi:hypothetical protein
VTVHAVVVPLVSLLVLLIPGLVLGLAAGLRLGTAVATAPLLTYGVTTVAATAASAVSFSWRPLTLVVATAVLATLTVVVRLLTERGRPWRRRLQIQPLSRPGWRDMLVIGGVAAGGLLSAGVLLAGFGRFGAPDQDWDYAFHSNAVRLISDTGDLAPAALGRINNWESASFYYPNTFHGLAAIVRDLTGASVFEVLNGQALLICLVAGLGLAGLLHRFGAPLVVTATTPLLLAGFASFPYDLLWRGPLLPFAAGVAAIPGLVLLLDVALAERRAVVAVLFGLGTAGLLGLHPSCALSAALFVLVYLLRRWWLTPRRFAGDAVLLVLAGLTTAVSALPAVLGAVGVGSTAQQDWPAVETAGQAVGDLLLLDHDAPAPQYWLAGLVIVGLLTLHRARYLWSWLGGTVLVAVLFVLAASSDAHISQTLTQPWWNDRFRLAGLAVLGLAPLAAHGLLTLVELARQLLGRLLGSRGGPLRGRTATGALAAAVLVLIVLLSSGLYAPSNSTRISWTYKSDATLNQAEITAMRWLAGHSDGGEIMNDPNDGSAYLSAVADLRPVFGHLINHWSYQDLGPTQHLLLEQFNCLDSNPDVRKAIRDRDIRYVFLGTGFVLPQFHRVQGLRDVQASPSLHLIYAEGSVQIYRVQLSPAPSAPLSICRPPGDAFSGHSLG